MPPIPENFCAFATPMEMS